MKFTTVAMAAILGMGLAALSLPAHAAEAKRAAKEKARAAKAPPSHVEIQGKRVPVVPPGTNMQRGKAPAVKRDLAVSGLQVPDEIRLDQPFPMSFYVRNHGGATVAEAHYRVGVRVLLPALGGPYEELASGVVRNVPPGRDVRVERTVEVSSEIPYVDLSWSFLSAVVDPDESVDEEDEDNNGMAVLLSISPGDG